jgi:hypothetical protein
MYAEGEREGNRPCDVSMMGFATKESLTLV